MNENSITGSIKQSIKSLVETVIPITKNCNDCVKIQSMQFQSNQKNTKLAELEEKIEKLETENRAADLAASESLLKDLNSNSDFKSVIIGEFIQKEKNNILVNNE